MGTLETEARELRRRGQIREALLATLVIGGAIAIGAAPRALMPRFGNKIHNERRYKQYVQTVAHRLVQHGLAKWVKRDNQVYLQITAAGRQKLDFEREKVKLSAKKGKWDRRWRMVAFDLPERRRVIRARLRAVMAEVGFVRLQDSVWIYPYDCEEFIILLKAELKIGKDALYAIVEKLENDKPLRTHFHLPE